MSLANKITLLRIFLIPLLALVLLSSIFSYNNWIAAALFLVIALTDYLDGYLARKMDQVTNFGKVFDPLADKLLIVVALLCLVELGTISAIPVMIIIVREVFVLGIRILASSNGKIIAANLGGKFKTVIQDLAVLMLILNIPYGMSVLWTAVVLTVVSGFDYIFRSREVLGG